VEKSEAEPVVNKVIKGKENPLYGQFSYKAKWLSLYKMVTYVMQKILP
jgi:hypothetical protein